MLRTKDLVLFVIILLLVLTGMIFTLSPSAKSKVEALITWPTAELANERGVVLETKTLDRESIIARLKQAIADGESNQLEEPAIVASETETELASSSQPTTSGVLQYCAVQSDAIALARTWPKSALAEKTVGTMRVFASPSTPAATDQAQATSSVVESRQSLTPPAETWATLPINPAFLVEPACLNSEVIGVSVTGNLLFNSDAIAYKSRSAEELLGYARDGWPIYGLYTGAMDECGGYQSPFGYRYTVSADRKHFLSCYRSAPQTFRGE